MYINTTVEINEIEHSVEVDFEFYSGEDETTYCPGESSYIDICSIWSNDTKADLLNLIGKDSLTELEEQCYNNAIEYYTSY